MIVQREAEASIEGLLAVRSNDADERSPTDERTAFVTDPDTEKATSDAVLRAVAPDVAAPA